MRTARDAANAKGRSDLSPNAAPRITPRLLTDIEAAVYIGASRSFVRALIANGAIRRVELPAADVRRRGQRARLLRIDLRDLDAWIEARKKQT